MTRHLQRLVVLLFVLLQGVAPLLHAHAAADAHGGVHLPGVAVDADDRVHPGLADNSHDHAQAAIGVASSLEARHDAPPLDATLPWRLTPTDTALGETRATAVSAGQLPAPPFHALPPPRAPPRA